MHEIQQPEDMLAGQTGTGCANCGAADVVPGYPTLLCSNCREYFIRFPIPLWVKLFGGAVCAIMLLALFTFPKNLSLGIQLERGKLAEQEKKYLTAQKAFTKVTEAVPDDVNAQGHLMLAAFYNNDFNTFLRYSEKLQGVPFEDDRLLDRLNDIVDRFDSYFPGDTLRMLEEQYAGYSTIPDSTYQRYLAAHPEDLYAIFSYASVLYDKEQYETCDSLLQLVLEQDSEYVPALRLSASEHRERGNWQASLEYCDRLLTINREASYAIASKARTHLKQKNDQLALKLALESVALDKQEPYNIATLAMAYHFNNQNAQRDELIREAKASKDTLMMEYVQYAIDVIDQKEKFRN